MDESVLEKNPKSQTLQIDSKIEPKKELAKKEFQPCLVVLKKMDESVFDKSLKKDTLDIKPKTESKEAINGKEFQAEMVLLKVRINFWSNAI